MQNGVGNYKGYLLGVRENLGNALSTVPALTVFPPK